MRFGAIWNVIYVVIALNRKEQDDMKAVKLTKTMLQDPTVLLEKAGAVRDNQSFPSHVFMAEQDHKILINNLKKRVKRAYPYLDRKRVEGTVALTILNYGPVTLKTGIQSGYLLVNTKEIENIAKQRTESNK
jgi:hypothetical protein